MQRNNFPFYLLLATLSLLAIWFVMVHKTTTKPSSVTAPGNSSIKVEPIHSGYRTVPVYQQQGGIPETNTLQPAKSSVVLQ